MEYERINNESMKVINEIVRTKDDLILEKNLVERRLQDVNDKLKVFN